MATTFSSKDAIERVKARLAELRKRQAERRVAASAASPMMVWPRDLNEDEDITTVVVDWGADPTGAARE